MGFTGKSALGWKLRYIQAFNEINKAWNAPDRIMARALRMADETISSLHQTTTRQRLLVNFANHVSQAKNTLDVAELAKIARYENINIGRNRFIDRRKKKNILMHNRQPYQAHIDQGYITMSEVIKDTVYGKRTYIKPLATGKGQIWIIKILRAEYEAEERSGQEKVLKMM